MLTKKGYQPNYQPTCTIYGWYSAQKIVKHYLLKQLYEIGPLTKEIVGIWPVDLCQGRSTRLHVIIENGITKQVYPLTLPVVSKMMLGIIIPTYYCLEFWRVVVVPPVKAIRCSLRLRGSLKFSC